MKRLLLLLLLPLYAGAQVTDSFSGTGALSGNWTQTSASGNTAIVRSSGSAVPTTSGTQGMAVYTASSFPNDQQAQAVLTGDIGGSVCVHMTTSGNEVCYLPEIHCIYVLTAGAGDHSVTCSVSVPVVGDTIKLSVVGNTYTAYNNGVVAGSGTDSTYTTGRPGIYVDQSTHAGSGFSNFAAGPYSTLSVLPTAVPTGSTGNAITLTGVGTAWTAGTPGTPTFTLSGGTGASITAQTVASSTSATITVNAGSVQGNLTITDPSTNNTATILVHSPVPYYQRDDGGTRYSTANPSGECNGLYNVSQASTGGLTKNCAFKYTRMGWADGTYTTGTSFPGWGWVMLYGDSFIVQTTSTGQESRVGWTSASDATYGIQGDAAGSGAPPLPDGTHLLGANYANCTSKTMIHGGFGVGAVLNVDGTKNASIECLEITDFAQCGSGAWSIGHGCSSGDDFARIGILSTNTNQNVTIRNVSIHGTSGEGMKGPNGNGMQLLNSYIGYESLAGWDQDLGNNTEDVGSLLIQDTEIEGSGCVEQYPIVAIHPGIYCTDQSHGGYGDAIGTATITGHTPATSSITCNRCKIHNSAQDGPDFLHGGGVGSSVTVMNSTLYSNMGQQAKLGGIRPVFINNQINGNNTDMCTPGGLPGWPAGYPVGPGPYLTDCGRGGNIDVLISPDDSYTSTVAYNSINSNSGYSYYFKCAGGSSSTTCTAPVVIFENNAFQGNFFSGFGVNTQRINADETPQGQGIFNNPGSMLRNNVTAGDKNTCPMLYETAYVCAAPGWVSPTFQNSGIGDYRAASGSSAIVGAGVPIPSVTSTDIVGNARSGTAPTANAYEFVSSTPRLIINRGVINRGVLQ